MLKIFDKAQSVWLCGREKELNCFAAFKTNIQGKGNYKIHISASTFYRIFINGTFVCFGPARTVAGYARVDIIGLDNFLIDGENSVVIEVVGYYCRSLSTSIQQSFLTAEIFKDNISVLYTGRDFHGYSPLHKQRVVEIFRSKTFWGDLGRKIWGRVF